MLIEHHLENRRPYGRALRFVSDILVVRANGAMCAAMLLFAALSALKKAE